jgi:RimJ/RimL family protein N-acetyltransferase/GNAT superfamily N-acetyltransferase
MRLTTKRIILRPWVQTDAESLYKYAKDPQVGPITGWPVHTNIENSKAIIKSVLSAAENYAVVPKSINCAVGSIGLMVGRDSNLELPDTEGEIGFWIGVPFWGQGLIPEAVLTLLRHGFEDLKLQKIWCGYYAGNEKSKRVQEKCGFTYHHTINNFYVKLMSENRTLYVNCMTKEDWKDVKIEKLEKEKVKSALSMVWEVFNEFEAPDYSIEGVEEFYKSIHDDSYLSALSAFGAFKDEKLVGIIATREGSSSNERHIALFFVDSKFHQRGIGKKLFMKLLIKPHPLKITVNASPYAEQIYQRLGFHTTDNDKTVNGLKFIPMEFIPEVK